jgi:hypothetical protein
MGGRLWRLPPFSANTWHKHADQWELYFVLSVLVRPDKLRQVFNDTSDEVLWLIVGAPQDGASGTPVGVSDFYPEDPKTLPPELTGHVWPPTRRP